MSDGMAVAEGLAGYFLAEGARAAILAGLELKVGDRIEITRDVDGKLHIDVLVLSGAKYALANLKVGSTVEIAE